MFNFDVKYQKFSQQFWRWVSEMPNYEKMYLFRLYGVVEVQVCLGSYFKWFWSDSMLVLGVYDLLRALLAFP